MSDEVDVCRLVLSLLLSSSAVFIPLHRRNPFLIV